VGYAGDTPTTAQIIDFKTDAAAHGATPEQLEQLALSHRPQLDTYRRAAAMLYRLDPARVETAVLFTEAPAVVTVPSLQH